MNLEHWETYYRGGALATCPLGSASGYTLELYDAWVEFFAGLADASRILDVGTGNGAIALIAKETAGRLGHHYEIHGTDLAQIDPVRDVAEGEKLFAGIQFHELVATERLPFPAASFNAVSGQYALEYAAVEMGLREIFRVLQGGGQAQFIMHHADSVILHNAQQSLKDADLILNRTKIFRRLRRHLEAERRSPVGARRTWVELVAAVSQLQSASGKATSALMLHVTLDAVQQLLNARQQLSRATMDRQIHVVEADIRASVRRLQDLVGSAQSVADIARIKDFAGSLGFVGCEARTQFHDGANLVGWRLNLRRP
ncbi:MAG: class I SAM-dependent methyltransferase [Steroidobacteraceae bacterium]